jgi:hypothetical protein
MPSRRMPVSREQTNDRGVAPVAEVLAGAVRQPEPHMIVGEHEYGLLSNLGGRILAIGDPSISPSSSSQLKNCCSKR